MDIKRTPILGPSTIKPETDKQHKPGQSKIYISKLNEGTEAPHNTPIRDRNPKHDDALNRLATKPKQWLSKLINDSYNENPNQRCIGSMQLFGGARYFDHPKNTVITLDCIGHPYNANTVGDSFIASHGPTTGDKSIAGLFTMAMENEGSTIVNLDKQLRYWPETGEKRTYDLDNHQTLSVTTKKEEDKNTSGYDVITLELESNFLDKSTKEPVTEKKTLTIYHFLSWPDMGVPVDKDLQNLSGLLQTINPVTNNEKLITHCMAGIGRTSTFITLLRVIKDIDSGIITSDNLLQSINDLVLDIKKARGIYAVETSDQLKLILEQAELHLEQHTPSK
ncbi:tyrosine-protein phosphatase [uncultured Endozoicomonas sp.]|uniref:tyrosine-protein phosphatase n=1 Tax=uncultured Endozoicomonas sp. TaxID=432652 RepID=UPI0026142118|nr:tyrosine-protein phosphatase [uncultured Endozoicomonas sp.]